MHPTKCQGINFIVKMAKKEREKNTLNVVL